MTKQNYTQLWQVLPAAVLSFFLSLVTPSQAQESPEIKQQIDGAIEQLQDSEPDNDAAALQQLGEIGPDAKDTALEIIKFLDAKKYSPSVRSEAAVALARIQPQADLVVDELLTGLSDRNEHVRVFVAIALGRLGEPVLDDIIQVITDSKKIETRDAAWLALEKMAIQTADQLAGYQNKLDEANYLANLSIIVKITRAWDEKRQQVSPEQLKNAITFLDKFIPNLVEAKEKLKNQSKNLTTELDQSIKSINQNRINIKNFSSPSPSYPWQPPAWLSNTLIFLVVYSLFPLTWVVILWVNPLGLLWIMKILLKIRGTVTIPGTGISQVISLHYILMLDYFHYHPRVLDAWVNKYIEAARTGFEQEETVKNNLEITLHVKIEINDKRIDNLTKDHLHDTFVKKTYGRLLIWGEAGLGKTSWACTIARWGMAPDQNQRLCPHLMIPLLIEGKRLDGQYSLLEVIMGELQGDILNLDIDENISSDFLLYLLRRKRILVIVDNFSEMSEGEKDKINPLAPDFPINALIVTSQKEEDLGKVVKTKVKLSRLNANARGDNLN
ncbi:MAG: hypothetical protein Fur0025_30750 [Oscillatoriaceae cyanobacterium]